MLYHGNAAVPHFYVHPALMAPVLVMLAILILACVARAARRRADGTGPGWWR